MGITARVLIDLDKVFSALDDLKRKIDLFVFSIPPSEMSVGLHARINKYNKSKDLLGINVREKPLAECTEAAEELVQDAYDIMNSAIRISNVTAKQKNEASELRKSCKSLMDVFRKYNSAGARAEISEEVDSLSVKIRALMDEHERHDARHQKLLSENAKRINDLELKVSTIYETADLELKKVRDVYAEAVEEIDVKRGEVNRILGLISGDAVAGSFEESAKAEKSTADIMRWLSISCMAVIVTVASCTLIFTLVKDFDWRISAFSLAFAALLSVPSAYLARESAKHRGQHNKHLQLALELKAINPYIASLPVEEQHRIKSEVASRIFCVKDDNEKLIESYPINIQEIFMEILKKIEIKGKS